MKMGTLFWLEGLRNDISFKVIQPEVIKADKMREGGPKIGKMGRRRLWMAPKSYSILS